MIFKQIKLEAYLKKVSTKENGKKAKTQNEY